MMMGAQKFNLLRFLQNEVFQRRILHFWKKVFFVKRVSESDNFPTVQNLRGE